MSKPEYLKMDHGTDIEKGLYTFSEVRSCSVLHRFFPFFFLLIDHCIHTGGQRRATPNLYDRTHSAEIIYGA
jgi:hypothetical protein